METLRLIFTFFSSLIFALSPQKSYTHGLVGQPRSYLPNEVVTENDKTVSRMLFRGLFRYDDEGDIVMDLADSYDISKDGLEYTIYLKKGQKWSNGNEITADDLLFSAFTSNSLKEIATDKIDKYTIRYTLPNKYSPFLSILTMGVTPSIQNNTPLQPVSSGPYKIVRLKKEGPVIKEAVLQEMETSYRIGKLSFRYYEDEDQVITAQKLGEIEGFTSNKEHSWPNINKTVFFQRGIYYSLIFNLKNKDLTKEVRKKLLIATPEKQISEELGLLANGPISESQFTSTKLKFDIHDPSVTDTLNINLKVVVPQGKEYEFITDLLGQSWKKLGVSIQVMKLSSDEIENEIIPQRDFDVLLYGQEVSRDPDRYPFWHSTRIQAPGLNISGFENIRADRALEEGRNVVPEEERIKHYEIFQESMLDYTPAIFLYHPKFYLYTNKRVKVLEEPKTYYTSDIFNSFRNWDVN